MLAAALAVFALVRGSDLVLQVGIRAAAAALVVFAASLVFGWPKLFPVSLGLLGAVYALYLAADDPPLDAAAPAFAACLLVTAELAYWSLEERDGVRAERGETLRRVGVVAAEGVVALVLGSGLLALSDAARTQGLAVDLAGAAAAAAALLFLARLARR